MNENVITCLRVSNMIHHVTSFESTAYESNRVFNVIFLAILIFPTILLNAVAVITIQKTPQLRNKLSHFIILVQSSVDLGVGCFATPMMIIYLLSPFTNVDVCFLFAVTKSTIFFLSGLSTLTLCALTMERYLGIFHPFFHRAYLTKKGIVTYTMAGVLILTAVVIASIISGNDATRIAGTVILAIFLIFNTFAYVRIYFLIPSTTRESPTNVVSSDKAWPVKGRRHFGKTKHVSTCFIVVISFTILLLPYVLSPIFVQFESMMWNAYFFWAVSLIILNSSINSITFFWKNRVLRKEAIKIVKDIMNH